MIIYTQSIKERLINAEEEPVEEPLKHWFWDNWILLGFCAMLCFVMTNLVTGSIAHLGFEAGYY